MVHPSAEYVVMDGEFDTRQVYAAIEAAHAQEKELALHLATLWRQLTAACRAVEREQTLRKELEQKLARAQAQLERWESRDLKRES